MGCCDSDSVQVSKMSLELRSGPMLWHKKRFFGSNWRDVHSVLYNDSSFFWFRDKSRQEQEGGIVLKDAPELIAFGPFTSQVPDRPPLPEHYEQKQFLAFGVRGKDVVYWFLCPNQEEVTSWMSAIASTMPIQPGVTPSEQVPVPTESYSNGHSPNQMPQPQLPHQPMSSPMNQQTMPAPPYVPQQPPPQYTPTQQQLPSYVSRPSPGVPGQHPPPTNYRPPPYQGYNQMQTQPYPASSGGGTTVVVQQPDRPTYIGGGGFGGVGYGGGGDFAMGMLVGGALGTAWGARPLVGVGFGCGGGWSHGTGWSQHSSNVNDTDVTINNYYDNDTTIVNNNMDMTNNVAIDQASSVPQALPIQEDTVVEEYVPVEDVSNVGYDGGYEAGYDNFSGGGYDADIGGGDFGGDFGDPTQLPEIPDFQEETNENTDPPEAQNEPENCDNFLQSDALEEVENYNNFEQSDAFGETDNYNNYEQSDGLDDTDLYENDEESNYDFDVE